MSEYQWKTVSVVGFDELMRALERADRKGYMSDAIKEEWEAFNWKPEQPEQEPEFFTHNVEQPYDWSEWVCPDPKGYLMKCCDCGLVHEAEFGVVRYKSETEREDCDIVDDPNLQAVFRMRRSEQWSPEDTAQRAGGLPMAEQPAQPEPVDLPPPDLISEKTGEPFAYSPEMVRRLIAPPAQRTWVVFPTMLRKMWSGSEVQAWLDETVNKENT
jgi:hypothetical protein